MTEEQFRQVEARLSRVEALAEENNQQINQLIEYQTRTFQGLSDLTQVVGQVARSVNQLTESMSQLTDRVDRVTERVDSLAAASERFDRILDYLLKRDGGADEPAS